MKLRKTVLCTITVILLLALSCSALASGTVTATASVNIRKGPGLDYATITSVTKGKTFEYADKSTEDDRGVTWYRIYINGSKGWISSRYSELSVHTDTDIIVRATASTVLRKGPGTDYAKLSGMPQGRELTWVGSTSYDDRGVRWYRVRTVSGQKAWVSERYTELVCGEYSDYVTADSGSTRIRKGPGLDYTATGTLAQYSSATYLGEVEIDDRDVAWYRIRYKGKNGWVSSRYTSLD